MTENGEKDETYKSTTWRGELRHVGLSSRLSVDYKSRSHAKRDGEGEKQATVACRRQARRGIYMQDRDTTEQVLYAEN